MRVMCVAGARPNFVKIKPIVDAFDERGVETLLVHTGQHYDEAMSEIFFDELDLRQPDIYLGKNSGTHAQQTANVMVSFERVLGGEGADWVVVVGDVNSTLACSLVVAKSDTRLAHVEAGLRSFDWAMPEEVNRVVTDRVSDLLLAPSSDALTNLAREGYSDDRITLVVTLHRPSNVDDKEVLGGLVSAFRSIAKDLPLIFPVHPRTRQLLKTFGEIPGLTCIDPVGYLDFISLESAAQIVMTDSGGVQEETTALGIPCLTLRENTERPITVTNGTNRVVGTNPATIVSAARDVLANPPVPRCPDLWDGRAASRIVDAVLGSSARWR
jgi:UDP-N-acetylglucosamine 2-epimerase (non-hydrolysing)